MKFVVIAVLVACLAQGNNAQFGLRTLASLAGHAGSGLWNAGNTALGMAGSAIGVAASSPAATHAKKAINCWLGWCDDEENDDPTDDAAANAAAVAANSGAAGAAVIIGNMPGLESLSAASEGVLGSALSGMEEDELTELVDKLNLAEHLETILGAQIAVGDQSMSIADRLRNLVYGPIALTGCSKERVTAASDLVKLVAEIPRRAATLVKEGYFNHRECSEHSTPNSRKRCVGEKLVPITVRAAIMVRETNDYTMEAIKTVKDLRRAFGKCAREAKNAEAAKLALQAVEDTVKGVADDIHNVANAATAAAAAAGRGLHRK